MSGSPAQRSGTDRDSGFTPQYTGLEELYKTYSPRGLEVLGFPSNEFGGQEPGTDEDIASFCQLNHGVTFPLMKKVRSSLSVSTAAADLVAPRGGGGRGEGMKRKGLPDFVPRHRTS